MTSTISEKCETLYNKLNSFVTSVISRDVTPKISNLNTEVWGSNTQTGDSRIDTLESDVSSLSTSITNLVQVQYVSLNFGSINSGANGTKTATVTACPSGYTTMIVPKTTSWCIVYSSSVSGTTLSVSVSNTTTISHTCSCGVYVIYYPSNWNI